jgi:tetratricopeptide (TPR) repeat protein
MAENKHYKVYHILKDSKNEMNRYKFALSCSKINKYKDAERALLGSADQSKGKNYEFVANGSYGLYLLGVVCEKQIRYADAKEYFLKALEMNPTLWSAYEKLGKLGENIMPNKIFNEVKMKNFETNYKKTIVSTPISKKRKEEEEKLKRTVQTQLPKRKNSIHSAESSSRPYVNSGLMSLLKKFADGYYNLCMYNCIESVEEFKKLPQNHFNTGWVLTSIGRAYMEIVKYN